MFIDPSGVTLGQIASAIRDFSIVAVLLTAVWKARGVYESITSFFERVTAHIDTMEKFADTVVNNHLKHLEADIRKIARHQIRATDAEQDQYEFDDDVKD
jgi:CTP:phosphocholine cytidylyltransferase-like protein